MSIGDEMKTVKKDKLEYLVFENLSDLGIKHCFSTRYGGVSNGCYSSLNLAFRDDNPENVRKNYDIICSAIGVDSHNTFWTKQVHEDNIIVASEQDRGKGLYRERTVPEGYDAVITDVPNVVLTGFSADCVLIYFYDKTNKAIGIAHSGWRGTVKAIGAKVVKKLGEVYGTKADELICGIAPAIGVDCFQVDEPVVTAFRNAFDFVEEYIFPDKENRDRWFIDLHGVNEQILIEAGVSRENIENSRICTKCDPNRFFSHRVMGNERGSLAGLISL